MNYFKIRKQTFVFVSLFFSFLNYAQTWTWIHASDTANVSPITGTMGIPGTANRPGGLSGSTSWTDLNGNFWLFGGDGTNDLWKYEVSTDQWTWVKGTGGVQYNTANYGTLNTPALTNNPGGRGGAVGWTDSNGDLWLFGGFGVATSASLGYLNDLWKYSIATNEWTWVNGSNNIYQSGVYGTQGTPASTNTPGARDNCCTWVSGNFLWLYGGSGRSAVGSQGYLGDLWKYDVINNQWTWVQGSNSIYPPNNQGTLGVPSIVNTPGARSGAAFWKDNSGNFWVLGGNGALTGFGSCTWGDLWKYDPSTNIWVCVKGLPTAYESPAYGTQGIGSSATTPGSRIGTANWIDNNGDFWLFGGWGNYQSNVSSFNDLWKYNIITNQWTWMKGPMGLDQPGSYGTKQYPAASNNPKVRSASCTWKDSNGNLWLFGGANVTTSWNYFADLWRLSFCTTQPPSPLNITASSPAVCGGGLTALSVSSSTDLVFWSSSLTGSTIVGSGSNYTVNLTSGGTHTFSALSVNMCTTSIASSVTLSIKATPTLIVNSGSICIGNTYTIIPTGVSTYTFLNGSEQVAPTITTSYSITGQSAEGCPSDMAISSVTITPLPLIAINSGSICSGAVFTLNPTGGVTYSYSGNSQTVSPLASTFYTVTGNDASGCLNVAISSVDVFQLPPVSVNSGSVCNGSTFTITPSGAISYSISGGSYIVNPFVTSNYTISGEDNNGCINTAISNVDVLPVPTVGVNSGSVCVGSSFTLIPTGAVSYTPFGATYTVTPLSTTLYLIIGENGVGCTSTAESTVSVLALPLINVNSGSICAGTVFTINPSGGISYTISGNSQTVSPLTDSNYTITGIDAEGCINEAISTINVFQNPLVSVNSGSVCSGSSFTLTPSGANSYTISGGTFVVNPLTNSTYSLFGESIEGCISNTVFGSVSVFTLPIITVNSGSICAGDVFTLNPVGGSSYTYSGNSQTVSPLTNSFYTITGIDNNGCISQSPVVSTIIVQALPNVGISPSLLFFCQGETNTLSASGANSYSWSTGDNSQTVEVNISTSTSYSVKGTDNFGCMNITSIALIPDVCTGLSTTDKGELSITVFPNPITDHFQILCNYKGEIFITDNLGRTILRGPVEAGVNNINVSGYEKGIYILNYVSGYDLIKMKLIKE